MEKGYQIKMKDHTLTLLDTHGAIITKVTMTKNRMFLLNIETCLWHMRLEHVNFDSLKMTA